MNKRLLKKYDGKKHGWLQLALQVAAVAVISIVLMNFVIGVSHVTGTSMEPTIKSGDLVAYLRVGNNYDRGDVVVIEMPSGELYMKRVIAVEGDVVDIRNNNVYINNEMIDEDYIKGNTSVQEAFVKYPLLVKEESVFIMGDNRDKSVDSRNFGTISVGQIKGKLLFKR